MIEEEIDLYPEVTIYQGGSSSNYPAILTDAEFAKRVAADYKTACDRLEVGDTFSSLSQPTARLTCIALISNPSACTRYQGDPCIIEAKNPLHQHSVGIKYSLKEIDWSTVERSQPPQEVH